MTKKTILMVAGIALIFILGILIGAKTKSKSTAISQLSGGKDTFQAGWEAAKKRLADSGFASMGLSGLEIKNLIGEVKKIENNKITLKTAPLEPLADPELDERIVLISNNTKIYKYEEKDAAVYKQEMEEFNKKMQQQLRPTSETSTPSSPIVPPEFRTKKEAAVSDLKENQRINVIAAENIKDKKEFTAIEIDIEGMPVMPNLGSPMPGSPIPPVQ